MSRLISITQNFIKNSHQSEQKYQLELHYLDYNFTIYYDLTSEEDPKVLNIYIKDEVPDFVYAYFSLIQGIALEALKRVSAKEFDFYIRDDQARPYFEYYGPEVYKLLALGEEIYNKHLSFSTTDLIFDPNRFGDFFNYSFSEQIELFEEFLSKYIYPHRLYSGQDFDLDIENKTIKIIYEGELLSEEIKILIHDKLKEVLYLTNTTILFQNII